MGSTRIIGLTIAALMGSLSVAVSVSAPVRASTSTSTEPALAPGDPDQPVAPPPVAQPTQATDSRALVHQAFMRADANRDGKLSPDEANLLPAVAAKFGLLDTDHDGFISEAEFTTGVRIGD